MTLHTLTDDGQLTWYCPGGHERVCGMLHSVSLDEVIYQDCPLIDELGKGAVIVLPTCPCGTRVDLKADYTLKELAKALELVADEQTDERAYVLPLRYVHNLRVHWMLYQSGKATHPPVLEMPPQALLEHPSFASVKPSTVYALWFGYSTMKQYAPQKLETQKVLLIGA